MDAAIDAIIVEIENDSFKNAIALCEKSLKKWPNNIQIFSLKSLALWYSGNEDQSRILALEVVKKQPKDHFTISIIERVLEFMDKFELIASLCDNSLKYGYDIRIAEKLFFACLKLQDTKKLYSIASKMYNFSKNQVYLYWAIIGLIFESRNICEREGQVTMELAKRLIEKLMVPFEPKLNAEYKLLKIIVAQLAGDNSEILKAIDIESKFDASDNINMAIDANIALGKIQEAKIICLSHIEKSSYIDAKVWGNFLVILNQLENGVPLAKNLIKSFESKNDVRGIKCASIELKIMHSSSYSESLSEMLFDFSISLIQKPSTFNDVVFFLKKIDEKEVNDFHLKIIHHLNSLKTNNDILENGLFFNLHRFLYMKSDSKLFFDSKIILQEIYSEMDSLNNPDERYYSLALFRCLCMIDDYVLSSEKDPAPILHFLQKVSVIFDEKYVFGLLNIVISLSSGQFDRAFKTFRHLEIKCLQLDTLGYLILDHALNLFAFSDCESLCAESAQLYSSNRRDTWGLLCQSLENQAFTSVIDFYDFYNQLERSIQNIATETNFIKMNICKLNFSELLDFASSDRALKAFNILSYSFGSTFDNRDVSIFDTVDATGNLKQCLMSLNFFKIEEAKYYYNFISMLLNRRIGDNISSQFTENSVFERINGLMSNSSSIEDLIVVSKAFMNEMTSEVIKFFLEKDEALFSYHLFAKIYNYGLKMKEIMIISLIKLRFLNSASGESSSLTKHFKSRLEEVKLKIEKVLETTRGINEDHLLSAGNISKFFDNLLLLDYIAQ